MAAEAAGVRPPRGRGPNRLQTMRFRPLNLLRTPAVQPMWVGKEGSKESAMFRIYEWSFSSTAELAVGILLAVTILSAVFV